jgi:hypothetical protein
MSSLLVGLFILLGMYVYRIFHHGELANKPIWALMQSFAAKEEYTPPHTLGVKIEPVFVKDAIKYKKTYDLLGIPTKNVQFPYYWIITNTHIDNDTSLPMRVFTMADGDVFYLPCDYLDNLSSKEKIDIIAYEFLRERCIKGE